MRYAFWNNKGGTGKTSLAFQAICRYAELDSKKTILAIDACPQANLSELFLGGLTGGGGQELLKRQGLLPRCSIGGYFQARLPSPYTVPTFDPRDFITVPANRQKSTWFAVIRFSNCRPMPLTRCQTRRFRVRTHGFRLLIG